MDNLATSNINCFSHLPKLIEYFTYLLFSLVICYVGTDKKSHKVIKTEPGLRKAVDLCGRGAQLVGCVLA